MRHLVIAFAFLFICALQTGFAQNPALPQPGALTSQLKELESEKLPDANNVRQRLQSLGIFPEISTAGADHDWFYNDSTFGKIPVRVFIPAGYKPDKKWPCILLLHGAASRSNFNQFNQDNKWDDFRTFKSLGDEGYIVIRPIADQSKKFIWVINKFGNIGSAPNLTYQALNGMLTGLKDILNIDDDRVFAFGHSDGADGACGLAVHTPDAFAGIVAYNSMLDNISDKIFYIRNVANRPLYAVHSDLDDIRPIEEARETIDGLKRFDDTIRYKEYFEYKHFDKHLQLDRQRVIKFMKGVKRNPFHSNIYWETDGSAYNTCDWLTMTAVHLTKPPFTWYQPFTVRAYNKITKEYQTNFRLYQEKNKAAAVKGKYQANRFTLQTSGITELEIKISPQMVDITQPVTVIVNGKQVYTGKVIADRDYILQEFAHTLDRKALWVNTIKVKVE